MITLTLLLLGGVSVQLPAEAHVGGAAIRLGDVATITGDDAAEVARVQALELGYAPSPGYSRLLARWKIERQVAESLPGIDLTFAGADAVRVLPRVRELAVAELEAAARAALVASLGGVEAVLTLVEPIASMVVPAGEVDVRFEAEAPTHELAAGRWTIPVRVRLGDALYRTVWTTWQVELSREMPVLVRDIPAGAVVGPDAVRFEAVRMETRLSGTPIDASTLVGTIAARPLSAGAVLLERDVKRALLVKQNESVQLEVQNGAVTARVAAVARQSGHHGSLVRVQVATTGREITARVIGQDLVRVALGSSR